MLLSFFSASAGRTPYDNNTFSLNFPAFSGSIKNIPSGNLQDRRIPVSKICSTKCTTHKKRSLSIRDLCKLLTGIGAISNPKTL